MSRILCVPTNAFELVEFAAARDAARERRLEPRQPLLNSIDVLQQHMVTAALGGGFTASEMLAEARSTYAFAGLDDATWAWTLDFVSSGGAALGAYPQYSKIALGGDGVYTVPSREVARWHRLGIGTITSDSMVRVQFLTGGSVGHVEESFIARLRAGDRFLFSGRLLELVVVKEMTAYVRSASGIKGTVPKWAGSRMPLSSELGRGVQAELARVAALLESGGELPEGAEPLPPELVQVAPVLALQERWSRLPRPGELLVEQVRSREGHHLFVYPFEGRFVHEGLGALIAYRLSRRAPASISVSANDYGFELHSPEALGITSDILCELCALDGLLADLMACANATELARRKFRDIARIAGLVFTGYPGAQKQARQLQASSGLLWDVFTKYDPGNLLVGLAEREVLQSQLELTRLWQSLERIAAQPIAWMQPARLTPLAFPIWAERIQAQVSSQSWTERVQKMAVQLEAAAAKPEHSRRPTRRAGGGSASGGAELRAV